MTERRIAAGATARDRPRSEGTVSSVAPAGIGMISTAGAAIVTRHQPRPARSGSHGSGVSLRSSEPLRLLPLFPLLVTLPPVRPGSFGLAPDVEPVDEPVRDVPVPVLDEPVPYEPVLEEPVPGEGVPYEPMLDEPVPDAPR